MNSIQKRISVDRLHNRKNLKKVGKFIAKLQSLVVKCVKSQKYNAVKFSHSVYFLYYVQEIDTNMEKKVSIFRA